MRHVIQLLAVGALALSAATTCTDLTTNDGGEFLKLLANDGAQRDFFGGSVAVSGTTVIVGAVDAAVEAAYLFDATTGRQIAKLVPDDETLEFGFGLSVAINEGTAIVGALGRYESGDGPGSAYLFNSTTGQQIAKLTAAAPAAVDGFGYFVAIDGNVAIVGAPWDLDSDRSSGSAYLFDVSDPANPGQIARLLPDDGAYNDAFGLSVGISGTTAIVGAIGNDDNGDRSGSAYIFDTVTGQQIAKLLPDDGAEGDTFGWSVAVDGTIAIVGAPEDQDSGRASGSAYLFDTTSGQQVIKLLPDDGAENDTFGESVAISGATAIVGAKNDNDNGDYSGSAYLFDAITGRQTAKLLPHDGARGRSVWLLGGAQRHHRRSRGSPS